MNNKPKLICNFNRDKYKQLLQADSNNNNNTPCKLSVIKNEEYTAIVNNYKAKIHPSLIKWFDNN